MSTPIITDGTTDRLPASPRVVLPTAAGFADRAARFAQLASGHPMGDYLALMGRLARAQHELFARRPAPPADPVALERSREHGMPPLAALGFPRHAAWREDLRDLLAAVERDGGALPALAGLRALSDDALEALADRLLAGETLDADAAAVPFVGAALQLHFARMAAAIPVADVERCDVATVCPVCATRPVASVVRIGGDRNRLRYLACALCGTEWNMVRVQCTACETDKGVNYLSLAAAGDDPADPAAALRSAGAEAARRAEVCDECQSYLKIFYQDKDPAVDPTADDLASLALDLLVDEQGYRRTGPNLLFHPGRGE